MGKGQKKKPVAMSLHEFVGDSVAVQADELPTAPREDTGDGSYDDRRGGYGGRDGDRYDRGPRMYENEDGERVEFRSQADDSNNWRPSGGGGGGGGSSFGDRGGYGGDRGGFGGDRGGFGGDRGGFGDRGGDRGGYGDRGGDRGDDRGGERAPYERSAGFNPRGLEIGRASCRERV